MTWVNCTAAYWECVSERICSNERLKNSRRFLFAVGDDPQDAPALSGALKSDVEKITGRNTNEPEIQKLAADTGLSIKHLAAARLKPSDPAAYAVDFRQIQERLIVMTRSAFADRAASEIAAARRVPMMVVEPEQAVADETRPLPPAML